MSTLAPKGRSFQIKGRLSGAAFLARLLRPASLLLAGLLLGALYMITLVPVFVTVNGVADTVYTHRRTVDRLLLDLGIDLQPNDHVLPPLESPIRRDLQLTVEQAYPFRVLADGRDLQVASWGATAEQVLIDAGIAVDPADQVVMNGATFGVTSPLPPPVIRRLARTYDLGYAWQDLQTATRRIRLYRSIPLTVVDGGLPFTLRTTAETVGAALREAKITLYLGDRVQPSLGSAIATGLRVTIDRSTPISVHVDGKSHRTRSRGRSVADVLAEMNVGLSGLDTVMPPPETLLYENIVIDVKRVVEDIEIQEEIAPFETLYEPDPNLPIDVQQTIAPGAEGVTRTRHRLLYEDNQEISKVFEDTWIAQTPSERIISFGTKIEPKTFTTADGQEFMYWRKIRMQASSYSAGTAGTSTDSPWYGRTFTGDPMRFGVVAVDPKIIPLRSQVYVPSYGIGDALDIGGAIRSRRIDLGYDDANLKLWSGWVDVYLLWPPPPDYQITWVVPNWPRPPQ